MTALEKQKRLVIVGATGMVGGYALRYVIRVSIYGSGGRQGIASSGFVSTRRATILAPSSLHYPEYQNQQFFDLSFIPQSSNAARWIE
jgi:hypothetical protein